ncbi:hypothetical protein CC1G_03725 [Coprinopsis cinerea okayama7|uniref:WW domain-containing protein n=1 Tax=Coprinopsis cinerea (strain Okayama-7 / 130 / ATCC MYA-4618 / FGSC 9003) TaxID=240176 RepID=A8N232_COPC7|nr:hypothetical protein CC1G_03725 [Coprinopsis cinerea okayama7\|eukprot:XP_001828931.2 hypothetical protein CC1G_03725 [Coprinopsis cinerea okayama7\
MNQEALNDNPLPPGWTEHWDHKRNLSYYVNLQTSPPTVTFVRPGSIAHSPTLSPAQSRSLPSTSTSPASSSMSAGQGIRSRGSSVVGSPPTSYPSSLSSSPIQIPPTNESPFSQALQAQGHPQSRTYAQLLYASAFASATPKPQSESLSPSPVQTALQPSWANPNTTRGPSPRSDSRSSGRPLPQVPIPPTSSVSTSPENPSGSGQPEVGLFPHGGPKLISAHTTTTPSASTAASHTTAPQTVEDVLPRARSVSNADNQWQLPFLPPAGRARGTPNSQRKTPPSPTYNQASQVVRPPSQHNQANLLHQLSLLQSQPVSLSQTALSYDRDSFYVPDQASSPTASSPDPESSTSPHVSSAVSNQASREGESVPLLPQTTPVGQSAPSASPSISPKPPRKVLKKKPQGAPFAPPQIYNIAQAITASQPQPQPEDEFDPATLYAESSIQQWATPAQNLQLTLVPTNQSPSLDHGPDLATSPPALDEPPSYAASVSPGESFQSSNSGSPLVVMNPTQEYDIRQPSGPSPRPMDKTRDTMNQNAPKVNTNLPPVARAQGPNKLRKANAATAKISGVDSAIAERRAEGSETTTRVSGADSVTLKGTAGTANPPPSERQVQALLHKPSGSNERRSEHLPAQPHPYADSSHPLSWGNRGGPATLPIRSPMSPPPSYDSQTNGTTQIYVNSLEQFAAMTLNTRPPRQ